MNPLLTGSTPGVQALQRYTKDTLPYDAYLRQFSNLKQGENVNQAEYDRAWQHYLDNGASWMPEGMTAVDPAVKMAADAIPAFAAPSASMYDNTAEGWDSYRTQARASSEGMNRMPFVYSNFAGIPEDPKVANALFFGGRGDPNAAAEAALNNPVLAASPVPAANAVPAAGMAPQGGNPLLAGQTSAAGQGSAQQARQAVPFRVQPISVPVSWQGSTSPSPTNGQPVNPTQMTQSDREFLDFLQRKQWQEDTLNQMNREMQSRR